MAKIKLIQTCGACPEQYDGYIDGENVAYYRLRHGTYTVEYKGRVVFRGNPNGDGLFENGERDYWLELGSRAVLEAHAGRQEMKIESFEIVSEEDG